VRTTASVALVLEEYDLVFHRAIVSEGRHQAPARQRRRSNSVPSESPVEKERLDRMVGRVLVQVVECVIGERGGRIC
jgi:hypothetical protein